MNEQDDTLKLTLGKGIQFLREKKGLSARQVSAAAGLSATYVSKVERGVMEPSLKAFGRIATALEMTDAEANLLVRLHAYE